MPHREWSYYGEWVDETGWPVPMGEVPELDYDKYRPGPREQRELDQTASEKWEKEKIAHE